MFEKSFFFSFFPPQLILFQKFINFNLFFFFLEILFIFSILVLWFNKEKKVLVFGVFGAVDVSIFSFRIGFFQFGFAFVANETILMIFLVSGGDDVPTYNIFVTFPTFG